MGKSKLRKEVRITGTITLTPDDPDYERIAGLLHMTRSRRVYAVFNAQYGEKAFNLRSKGLTWRQVAKTIDIPTEFAVDSDIQQVDYLARNYALKNNLEMPNFRE
jgi:hypothetical protein